MVRIRENRTKIESSILRIYSRLYLDYIQIIFYKFLSLSSIVCKNAT